jgi:hypothetical protein
LRRQTAVTLALLGLEILGVLLSELEFQRANTKGEPLAFEAAQRYILDKFRR